MATVSVSYLWIALEVRGAQERAAGEAIFWRQAVPVSLVLTREPVNRPWPFRGFPATQRETRGSPALCVSGSFQGNQRVFGAPFCFSRVSLGKLASFPESESWSGAKSGAKLRKSARYPGIFQVYRGFPGIPAKYPVFCRFWPQNSLRHGSEPPQNDEFHGVSPGFPEETRGCCRETSRKHGKETR